MLLKNKLRAVYSRSIHGHVIAIANYWLTVSVGAKIPH